MNRYEQNKAFYSEPILLNEEQKKNVLKVFSDFFVDFHLHENREYLANWLECALTTHNLQFSEATQRSIIVNFAKRLEELIEAAYIISQKKSIAKH